MIATLSDRVVTHWKTSVGGILLSGLLLILGSWHCQIPHSAEGWAHWLLTIGPAVLGLLAKDH